MTDPTPMCSRKRVFRVDREEIGYLRFTLESYDGMAVVSTLDPHAGLIEVLIAPGCEKGVTALLDSLRKEDQGVKIEEVSQEGYALV